MRTPETLGEWLGATVALISLCGTLIFVHGYFSTDAEASDIEKSLQEQIIANQKQLIHTQNRTEIWRAKREIRRLKEKRETMFEAKDLQENTDLIKEQNDLILCVRTGNSFCYD